uniref:forespore capture DNA-binding protein RefZ n=1 Tax=uncultured Allobacillus sp. TaxID=1638025 RepID=UPI0025963D01|nr:forespore capture DNA-binding protein RefZ [uncultured Allobacillus sp.]
MSEKSSRDKIMESAAELFYYNGFKGTSIRAITARANVNVSLISYYFKNKQGLLETMTVDYYERYLELVENLLEDRQDDQPAERILNVIEEIIQYKYENFQFTCFIQRELSLDNIFIREMFSTYVAKERYLMNEMVNTVANVLKLKGASKDALHIQLKSLLNAPFMYANDWQKGYAWDQSSQSFIRAYIDTFKKWLPLSEHST